LKVNGKGTWTDRHLVELAEMLPNSMISVSNPVRVVTPPLSTSEKSIEQHAMEVVPHASSSHAPLREFDLLAHIDTILPRHVRNRVKLEMWDVHFEDSEEGLNLAPLVSSLTSFRACEPTKPPNVPSSQFVDVVISLPAMMETTIMSLGSLTSLNLDLRQYTLDLDTLAQGLPKLKHLCFEGKRQGLAVRRFDFANLSRKLTVFHAPLPAEMIIANLAHLPPHMTDLKLTDAGLGWGYKPSSIAHLPTSLTRLEFPSSHWHEDHLLRLRSHLPHATHVVIAGKIGLNGKLLCEAARSDSNLVALDQHSIPVIMNRLLAPICALQFAIGGQEFMELEESNSEEKGASGGSLGPVQGNARSFGAAPSLDRPTVADAPLPLNIRTFAINLPDSLTALELRDPAAEEPSFILPPPPSTTEGLVLNCLDRLDYLPKTWPAALQTLKLQLAALAKGMHGKLGTWPSSLTSLHLLHGPRLVSYKPFQELPTQLVHLSLVPLVTEGAALPILPGHLQQLPATLQTFDCIGFTFPASDIPYLPQNITRLRFWGGEMWTDSDIGALAQSLPHLHSLHLSRASLTGAFLLAGSTEVTYTSLIKSVIQGIQKHQHIKTFHVGEWQFSSPLQLPSSVTKLHLVPPTRCSMPSVAAHLRLGSISALAPLPPNLTELSFAVTHLAHLASLGDMLPHTMQRLYVAAQQLSFSLYDWSSFPRSLKSIMIFQKGPSFGSQQIISYGVGFPPQLEELLLPQTTLAIDEATLPKSLTAIDFVNSGDRSKTLPWAKY
jgi:hypothetical protein